MKNRCFASLAIPAAVAVVALGGASATAQGPDRGWIKLVHSGCAAEPAQFHPCALERAKTYNPPRTPDGKPDMRGFWFGGPSSSADVEGLPDAPANPSLIVDPPDRKLPYRPWALAQRTKNLAEFIDPHTQCFVTGVPRQMHVPLGSQIVQSPDYLAIMFEYTHTFRIIPTDGRPHIGKNIRLWEGDPRGRWEGNTLVIDVTNANDFHWLDQAGNFYTRAAHIVERLTLIDPDTIHYQATIDDPVVYTRPWTMAFPIRRNPQKNHEQMEFACYEGERNTAGQSRLGKKQYPGAFPPE